MPPAVARPRAEPTVNHALIDVRDLHKTYHIGEVQVPAVRGVTLAVPPGQFVAIMGASGSGKSTFMHLLGCLDRPDQGDYLLDGLRVSDLSPRQRAAIRNQRIGFVFQSFNLLSRTSVLDNVALPLAYQGASRRERRRRSAAMLERLGLADRAGHHPNQLSGGQQQRVAIARALVTQPVLLLADEPTGNLDSQTSVEILTVIQALNRDTRLTVVLVTHETDVARFADRHVVFVDGRIQRDQLNPRVQVGTPEPLAAPG